MPSSVTCTSTVARSKPFRIVWYSTSPPEPRARWCCRSPRGGGHETSGTMKPKMLSPLSAKALCHARVEVAFIDVREAGEYADGHTLLSVSVPLSRVEPELARLVPRRETMCLFIDDGNSRRAEFAS